MSLFSSEDTPLSVGELTSQIKRMLEVEFDRVAVEGEISNMTYAPSGHGYFKLKDGEAMMSCVIWRTSIQRLSKRPENGDQVICYGKVSVYAQRGEYQLVVDRVKAAGQGALWERFQALKAKLEKEGLFDAKRKRLIPAYPKRVGIITSPTGAAIRDMLTVLERRAPMISVLIHPSAVQGKNAAREMTQALRTMGALADLDVIIIGRGGGSIEDLWEFNDESLAREIANCPIPVISAVGHETDFLISDFVADLRAPTPSAAAEIVSEGFMTAESRLRDGMRRLERGIRQEVSDRRRRIESLLNSYTLRRPEDDLRSYQQRVDQLLTDSVNLLRRRLRETRMRLEKAQGSLLGHNPDLILKKGYAIVRDGKSGHVIPRAGDLPAVGSVRLVFQDGERSADL